MIKPLRGNLDTRLRKLDDGEYAAIILAAAGLKRLGLPQRIKAFLEAEEFTCGWPRCDGGEIRSDRAELMQILAPLNHLETAQAVHAERTVSFGFGGSCQIPLAAFAQQDQGQMRLRAMVATPDGQRFARAEVQGAKAQAKASACKSWKPFAQDADGILAQCKRASGLSFIVDDVSK